MISKVIQAQSGGRDETSEAEKEKAAAAAKLQARARGKKERARAAEQKLPPTTLLIHIKGAKSLPRSDIGNASDPYCQIMIDGRIVASSATVMNEESPNWDEVHLVTRTVVPGQEAMSHWIRVRVKDKDTMTSDDTLGECKVPLTRAANLKWIVFDEKLGGGNYGPGGSIQFSVRAYTPLEVKLGHGAERGLALAQPLPPGHRPLLKFESLMDDSTTKVWARSWAASESKAESKAGSKAESKAESTASESEVWSWKDSTVVLNFPEGKLEPLRVVCCDGTATDGDDEAAGEGAPLGEAVVLPWAVVLYEKPEPHFVQLTPAGGGVMVMVVATQGGTGGRTSARDRVSALLGTTGGILGYGTDSIDFAIRAALTSMRRYSAWSVGALTAAVFFVVGRFCYTMCWYFTWYLPDASLTIYLYFPGHLTYIPTLAWYFGVGMQLLAAPLGLRKAFSFEVGPPLTFKKKS